jgi:hypothetical protein
MGMLLAGAGGEAGDPTPTPEIVAFDHFVRVSSPICIEQAAVRCVDAGWQYADTDRNGGLSLAELGATQNALRAWTDWRYDGLTRQERAGIALGLWLVNAVGLERLMASYDVDGDDLISRTELLADVRLDQRPLGEVLLDAEAVDRKAVARRLGSMAPLLDGVFQE